MAELAKWKSFYVIVGPSAGALIGVQFVIVTLLTTLRVRPTAESVHDFATPTLVSFGGALLVSALMSVPWPSFLPMSVALTACGLGGLGYVVVVVRCMRRQTRYNPVWEDWLWYAILPSTRFTALAPAALFLSTTTQLALFVIAGVSLGLLLIGIHNAWDTVTHIVLSPRSDAMETE